MFRFVEFLHHGQAASPLNALDADRAVTVHHAHLFSIQRAAMFRRRGIGVVLIAPGWFWYSGLATGMLGGVYPPEED